MLTVQPKRTILPTAKVLQFVVVPLLSVLDLGAHLEYKGRSPRLAPLRWPRPRYGSAIPENRPDHRAQTGMHKHTEIAMRQGIIRAPRWNRIRTQDKKTGKSIFRTLRIAPIYVSRATDRKYLY